ncbi:hypothetical protein HPB51_010726 [Rhipicephalus microplus]|uniref:WW domain-containing protein n=1 Tax=Rhipicephalus microplus TaxID=6941 RepID=A0A9J6DUW9_RHIMP|nr:hypothetical protein HPB51_010726 [Rhipicephalus microplus]
MVEYAVCSDWCEVFVPIRHLTAFSRFEFAALTKLAAGTVTHFRFVRKKTRRGFFGRDRAPLHASAAAVQLRWWTVFMSGLTMRCKSTRYYERLSEKEVDEAEQQGLPEGWERHLDDDGPYYWHIRTGTIQRERPREGTTRSLPTPESRPLLPPPPEPPATQPQARLTVPAVLYLKGFPA